MTLLYPQPASSTESFQNLTVRRDDVLPGLPEQVEPVQNRAARRGKVCHPRQFAVKDLMKMDFPPQRFVVQGLVPTGLIMLAGASKIGKSWASLDLALSVASGRNFMGRETDQGDVLYMALEDTPRRLQDRLKLIAHDMEWDELPLEFWTSVAASDEGGLEALREWLRTATNPKLVVVDIWGRFAPRTLTSKNEYDHLTQALQPLQALAAEYDVALVLVHHTRKTSGDAAPAGDLFDQILGSRAMTSNMDATMLLNRTRMQHNAVLSVTGRDIEETSINLSFDKTTYRWNETDRSLAPLLSPERQEVLDAFVAGHLTAQTIADHLGKTRTAIQNHMKSLLAEGLLKKVGRGKYYLPSEDAPDPDEQTPADMTDMADLSDNKPPPAEDLYSDLV
jgi:biotin operon repressor